MLLALHAHEETLHGALQATICHHRQKFWILGAKRLVKKVIHNCTRCTRFAKQAPVPLMGTYPKSASRQVCPSRKPDLTSGDRLTSMQFQSDNKVIHCFVCMLHYPSGISGTCDGSYNSSVHRCPPPLHFSQRAPGHNLHRQRYQLHWLLKWIGRAARYAGRQGVNGDPRHVREQAGYKLAHHNTTLPSFRRIVGSRQQVSQTSYTPRHGKPDSHDRGDEHPAGGTSGRNLKLSSHFHLLK